MTYNNIGHSILIIGSLWLHYTYGLADWITAGFIAFALATWTIPGFRDETKNMYKNINGFLKSMNQVLEDLHKYLVKHELGHIVYTGEKKCSD